MVRAFAALVGSAAVAGTVFAVAHAPKERVIGAYATSVLGRSRTQKINATLALRRLSGAVIKPGAEFSFNKRVGGFNRDAGYRRAPVSYNGQLIDSWGGGVCQASTTTYNAALLAGMTIVQRHPHQFCPSYVPAGRDAAVSFGEVDLVFKNPYAFPVRIEAHEENDGVVVQFLGTGSTPPVEVSEEVSQITQAGEVHLGDRTGHARQRNSGKSGYEVTVYRVIGNTRERVSEDSYPAMTRVVQYR